MESQDSKDCNQSNGGGNYDIVKPEFVNQRCFIHSVQVSNFFKSLLVVLQIAAEHKCHDECQDQQNEEEVPHRILGLGFYCINVLIIARFIL